MFTSLLCKTPCMQYKFSAWRRTDECKAEDWLLSLIKQVLQSIASVNLLHTQHLHDCLYTCSLRSFTRVGNVCAWSAEFTPPATVRAVGMTRCLFEKLSLLLAAWCDVAANCSRAWNVAWLVCSKTACKPLWRIACCFWTA